MGGRGRDVRGGGGWASVVGVIPMMGVCSNMISVEGRLRGGGWGRKRNKILTKNPSLNPELRCFQLQPKSLSAVSCEM